MRLVKVKDFLIIAAIAIVGLILGGVFDKDMSKALYVDTNLEGFGLILSNYLFVLFYFTVVIVASVGFFVSYKKPTKIFIPMLILIVGAVGFFSYKAFKELYQLELVYGKTLAIALCILILSALFVLGIFIGYKLTTKYDNEQLFKYVLLYTVIALVTELLMAGIKYFWSRPRPLAVFGGLGEYRNFWIIHPFESLTTSVAKEYYKSFPSGHVSGVIMILPALLLYTKLNKKFDNDLSRRLILVAVGIIALLTGLSRIMCGKHFLSDISAGFLIGFMMTFIGFFIADHLDKKHQLFTKEENNQ